MSKATPNTGPLPEVDLDVLLTLALALDQQENGHKHPWNPLPDWEQASWVEDARSFLAAIAAQGMVVVRKEDLRAVLPAAHTGSHYVPGYNRAAAMRLDAAADAPPMHGEDDR